MLTAKANCEPRPSIVWPSVLNTTPVEFIAAAGDRIAIALRNTTGGALTVDGLVQLEQIA